MLPVLVVEPYVELRTAIASVLGRAHVRCEAAATGEDALLKLRDSDYSYIVVDTDSKLPDMTSFYERLMSDPSLLRKVVVISDGGETPGALTSRPVLLKPFDAGELLAPLR